MTRIRCTFAILFGLVLTTEASAQFFQPVIGVPIIIQNGVDIRYRSGRLSINGFFAAGDPYQAILPVTPTRFGWRQAGPALLPPGYAYAYGYPPITPGFPFPGYGALDQRVTVQIINPVVVGRVGFRPIPDLSGIDLDVEPVAKIWGEKPDALAKNGKGAPKKGELVRAPKEEKKAEVARVENKKPEVAAANEVRPPVVLPPPPPRPDGKRLAEDGLIAFRNGEYGVASLRFGQAAEADQLRAPFLQAQACIAVGKYTEAADLIRTGLKLQPDWPTSDFRPKLELYANQVADWAEHRDQLVRAQKKQPKNADYFFLLGYMSWFDGQREVASNYFRQSRELAADPRWADAFLKVAAKAN